MAQGVSGFYAITCVFINRSGSIVDSQSFKRSSDPPTKTILNYPNPGTPNGESWLGIITVPGGTTETIDLSALPVEYGAASFTKSFNGIALILFQSSDATDSGADVTIAPSASNGWQGPWGASGVTLIAGGAVFNPRPAGVWPVDATHKLLDITAPAGIDVTFEAQFVGTRT